MIHNNVSAVFYSVRWARVTSAGDHGSFVFTLNLWQKCIDWNLELISSQTISSFFLHVLGWTVTLTILLLHVATDVCPECSSARIQARAQHVENYRYGTIYVRKITKDHSEKEVQQILNDVSAGTFFNFLYFIHSSTLFRILIVINCWT